MSIGIGVIGCGVRGQHSYELALAALPQCQVRAVSQYPGISPAMLEGKDAEAYAQEYAERLGADYCPGHTDLLAREDVQVVSLMCEPRAAPALVEDCCRAGKHIVRDKPMCLDLAGADRIGAAVEGCGSELLLTLGTRFSPTLRPAAQRLMAGDIGELLTATFHLLAGRWPCGFFAPPGNMEAVGGASHHFGHYARLPAMDRRRTRRIRLRHHGQLLLCGLPRRGHGRPRSTDAPLHQRGPGHRDHGPHHDFPQTREPFPPRPHRHGRQYPVRQSG